MNIFCVFRRSLTSLLLVVIFVSSCYCQNLLEGSGKDTNESTEELLLPNFEGKY